MIDYGLGKTSIASQVATNRRFVGTVIGMLLVGLSALLYCHTSSLRIDALTSSYHSNNQTYLTAVTLGQVTVSIYYYYLLLHLFCGLCADWIGSRYGYGLCALFIASSCIAQLLHIHCGVPMLRLLLAASSALSLITTLRYLKLNYPAKQFVSLNSLVISISFLAIIIGSDPYSWLLFNGIWPRLYLLCASLSILALLSLWQVSDPQRPLLFQTRGQIIQACEQLHFLLDIKVWLIALYTGGIFVTVSVFAMMWGETFLKVAYQFNGTLAQMSAMAVLLGVCVGAPLVTDYAVKIRDYSRAVIQTTAYSLALMLLILYYTHLPLYTLLLLLFMLGVTSSVYALGYVLVSQLIPSQHYGLGFALTNFTKIAVGAIVIQLIAVLLTSHWEGDVDNMQQIYTLFNFNFTMALIPICIGLALITTMLVHVMNIGR